MLFVIIADHHFLVGVDFSALHTPYGNATYIVVIIDGGNQHLQRTRFVPFRGGDVLQNGAEQHLQVFAFHIVRLIGSGACAPGAIEDGTVQLFIGSV